MRRDDVDGRRVLALAEVVGPAQQGGAVEVEFRRKLALDGTRAGRAGSDVELLGEGDLRVEGVL